MNERSDDARHIAESVAAVFEAGQARDFGRLRAFHAEDESFSRWANRPGGALLNITEAHEEEEALFGSLPPGTRVTPEQIRVDLFGPVAVSTFEVRVRAADGASLRRTRGTLVWHRRPEGWRIVHEHFSP
jgi:ketosteroid isomerase-like protein